MRNHVILCGYTAVTRVMIDRLACGGTPFVVIDADEAVVRALNAQGVQAFGGQCTEKTFQRAHLDDAVTVAAVTGKDGANWDIAETALRLRDRDHLRFGIIALIDDENRGARLRDMGVDLVVSPSGLSGRLAASKVLEGLTSHPPTSSASQNQPDADALATYASSDSHVLVVDDDTAERQNLCAIVSGEGYTVADVGSGQEALEFLQQSQVDLVLTDLFMSGVDGWELIESIKRSHPQTHVVVLSGNISEQGERLLVDRHIDGYLVKPVVPRRLQILFRALLLPGHLDRRTEAVVVDRDHSAIAAVEEALGDLGVYTKAFDNVRKAMHFIAGDPPNLVVTELAVGRHSGFDLIEDIRRSRDLPYIPILAVTTAPTRDQIRRAAGLHVNGILPKPLNIDALKSRALKLLEQGTVAAV